jgi:hypothetical protein
VQILLPNEGSKIPPWEQGSEFHLMEGNGTGEFSESPWKRNGLLFGSGRDAIKSILLHGMASMGWKRLWVPAYFCQKVVGALADTGIEMQSYFSWYPGMKEQRAMQVNVADEDVVLVVNHFGLKEELNSAFGRISSAAIIEDHTHDPWSPCAFNSTADYCIASLRKTLPVPDGGVLWSPKNRTLPELPVLTEEHHRAAKDKLEAMELKELFLAGKITDKVRYRTLSVSGEANLCGRTVSAVSEWTARVLGTFPVFKWRELRKQNHEILRRELASVEWVQVVSSPVASDSVPFSCILLFDSAERREFVRTKLIEAGIYPAVLWPLEKPAVQGIPPEHIAAGRRMLSIHCDMRYSTGDMAFVGEKIRNIGDEYQS